MPASTASMYARALSDAAGVAQIRSVVRGSIDSDTVIPLTQDTDGRLRVDAYIKQLVETNAILSELLCRADANQSRILELLERSGSLEAARSTPVILSRDQAAVPVVASDVFVSGVIERVNSVGLVGVATDGSTVEINCAGFSTVGIQLTGTFSFTATPQATIDGRTWVSLGSNNGMAPANSSGNASNAAAAGIWLINVAGFTRFRIGCTAYTSGKANVFLRASGRGDVGASVAAQNLVNGTSNVAATSLNPNTALGQSLVGIQQVGLSVVNIKASAGNVYGLVFVNLAAAETWLQFYNTAGTPVLGTGVIFAIPIAASASLVIHPGTFGLANFTTGIGIGAATTATGSGAPGTAPDVTIFYK